MSESKKNYRVPSLKTEIKKTIEIPSSSSSQSSNDAKIAEYEKEIESLCEHIKNLEEEMHRLYESKYKLDSAFKQNEKLSSTLQEAKEQIQALRKEV